MKKTLIIAFVILTGALFPGQLVAEDDISLNMEEVATAGGLTCDINNGVWTANGGYALTATTVTLRTNANPSFEVDGNSANMQTTAAKIKGNGTIHWVSQDLGSPLQNWTVVFTLEKVNATNTLTSFITAVNGVNSNQGKLYGKGLGISIVNVDDTAKFAFSKSASTTSNGSAYITNSAASGGATSSSAQYMLDAVAGHTYQLSFIWDDNTIYLTDWDAVTTTSFTLNGAGFDTDDKKFTNNSATIVTNDHANDAFIKLVADLGGPSANPLTIGQMRNAAVPEPTVAMLSLLAFAGLAARRRR